MNELNDKDLPRKLMLPPAEDLSFYREGDTLQQALYLFVLEERYRRNAFYGDVLWALNEAYYQCARVFDDPSPEADIIGKYLCDVEPGMEDFGYGEEKVVSEKSYFVFCLVYIALSVQASLPKSVSIFRNYLRPLLSVCKYINDVESCIQDIQKNGPLDSDLAPKPYPYIKYYYKDIEAITNGFNVRTIERILRRFRIKEHQLVFLEMVETSFYRLFPKEKPAP